MDLKVYDQKGKETGKIRVPKDVFGLDWNDDLVHQVAVSMQANKRKKLAHAKGRSEKRGGGEKPWRQKGTGRARHGSIRSPLWKGGGVTHGPTKERNYTKKINKKMKKKALFVVLSQKIKDGEVLILDDLKFDEGKTKYAAELVSNLAKIKGFEKLAYKKKNKAEVLISKKDENLKRAFKNLPGVSLDEARNLDPLDVLTCTYLVFLKDAIKVLALTSKTPVSKKNKQQKN